MGDLSAHFSRKEFACHCGCGFDQVKQELIAKLEKLRELCGGKPLRINSGCRCAKRNKIVGGAKNSQHLYGTAADVAQVPGISIDEMARLAEQAGFDGIGKYNNRIHVDVRGYKARWDMRK